MHDQYEIPKEEWLLGEGKIVRSKMYFARIISCHAQASVPNI